MRYFVILLAICLQACSGTSSETEFERLVRETGCTTADKVYRDYQRNEVAAQEKYQGRVNRICGIVDEIELNFLNRPVISLEASGWGVVSIGGVDSGTAARMSKGSLALFECGGINELLGNPVLTECSVLTPFGAGAGGAQPAEQDLGNLTPADTSPAMSAGQKSANSDIQHGTCKLRVSGSLMFDGGCSYRLDPNGSFAIYENYGGAGYFAMLERDGDTAFGYWNGSRSSDHAQDALGSMTRQGACWTDTTGTSEMCVWGS